VAGAGGRGGGVPCRFSERKADMSIGSGEMSGLMRWGLRAAAAGVVAAGLGGCNNALRDENAALMMEAQELRAERDQLRAELGTVESQRAALESEVQSLRQALASRGVGADSGFSGDGVTVSTRGREIVVGVAGDVLFDSGKVTIKPSAKATLDGIAATIKQRYPDKMIRVEGYTDTDPIRKSGWKTNERLSAERALAVEEYLVSRGLDPDRIYAAAFGASNPKATKRDSRRVEIVIVER